MLDPLRSAKPFFSWSLFHVASVCLPSAVFVASLAAESPGDSANLRQALELYRAGKCQEAEPLLEQLLSHQSKNITARKLLANCLLKDKKIDEARAQFQLVLNDAPQDVEALQGLRASVTEVQKREQLKQTLAIQRRAASAEELRASHEFETASKLIRARRWEEAEKILDGIVTRHPDSVPPRQRLAEIYSSTRRFDQAAETYRSLAEMPGASSVFLLRVGQNFEWSGKYPEASKYYRLYLKRNPNDLAARKALANVLMGQSDYGKAIPEFEQLRAKNPDDLELQIGLANALLWSGRYREAIPEFERLRAIRPDDLKLQLALAQSYDQVGDAGQAIKAYERVLQLDPSNLTARASRDRQAKFLDELPRQKAFAALERKDYPAAAMFFVEYLRTHPSSNETVLQIARVYSWGQRFSEAQPYYEEYLRRAPQDFAVVGELAKAEMWAKNYAAARKHYGLLVGRPGATREDYEGLIRAYIWDGDLEGAQPFAAMLAAIDPGNALARMTLQDFSRRQRLAARSRADELAVAGKFPEAVEAYRRYLDTYGKDPQIELLICRLYSWGRDYGRAAEAYREYLRRLPQDLEASLELANVENWAGHYEAAEIEYRAVLEKNPNQVAALVGLAQALDYQGKDPFRVRDQYLKVLKVDPHNSVAQIRLEEIRPLVAPALGYSQTSFWDSDGLLRSTNSIEATLALPGRIKLTPFYTFSYFRQHTSPENFRILGQGAGGRFEMSRAGRWSLLGELGAVQFGNLHPQRVNIDLGRSSLNGRAGFNFRPGARGALSLTYLHRDAVYELNSFASLVAGIMGDTVLVSYERPVAERVRFWISAGASHYSNGVLPSRLFSGNTQPRLSARLDYQFRPWIRLGYSGRLTGFSSRSALYFSPWHYQTHGLGYALTHRISKNLRFNADGEVDYGRITTNPGALGVTANTFEFAVAPTLIWQARRDLPLRLGYRFSRGRGSALGSPVAIYRTQGIEFSLSKLF